MKETRVILMTISLLAGAFTVLAGELSNSGFEIDFGAREDMNMWGDSGEAFGECYQVEADQEAHPRKAREGDRMLLINVPYESWDGIWQEIPWVEDDFYKFEAHYLIQGGDLSPSCATFMKVEFRDAKGVEIGANVGESHREDTHGRWKRDTLKGKTPMGTEVIRVVLIAGDSADGAQVQNCIYWDDAKLTK